MVQYVSKRCLTQMIAVAKVNNYIVSSEKIGLFKLSGWVILSNCLQNDCAPQEASPYYSSQQPLGTPENPKTVLRPPPDWYLSKCRGWAAPGLLPSHFEFSLWYCHKLSLFLALFIVGADYIGYPQVQFLLLFVRVSLYFFNHNAVIM